MRSKTHKQQINEFTYDAYKLSINTLFNPYLKLLFSRNLNVIFFIIFGSLIISGLLPFKEDWFRKYLIWSNEIRGVKTNITKKTLFWSKISGIGIVIFGLILIFGFFLTISKN